MICRTDFGVRLVAFHRLARDLAAEDSLLGFALVTVQGRPLPPVPVISNTACGLMVAMPVDAREHAVPWETQRQLARLIRRYVRRLERAP